MHAEQVTPNSVPVINFAECRSRATASTTKKRRSSKKIATQSSHPDAELIDSCIEYAAQVAASHAGYEIDPTDSEFAAFADDLAQSRARRALLRALDLTPATMDGARAKASLIKVILEDWMGDIAQAEKQFLISVASDVKRFQQASRAEGKSDVALSELDLK